MRITDLIAILNEHLDCYGNKDVLYLEANKAYPITYLGSGSSDFGDYFWMTSDNALEGIDGEDMTEFKAPPYKPDLKVVK